MSEKAAGEERLGELHAAVAEIFIEQLSNSGRILYDAEGNEVIHTPDARVLSSAVTFLNNNKIKATPFLSEKMSEIEQGLKNRRRRFKGDVVPLDAARRAADAE